MDKFIAVFLFELRSILRRRSFQISTIAFPLVAIVIVLIVWLISAASDEEPQFRGYVDRWGSLPTESPVGSRLIAYATEETAQAALLDAEIEAYFVIPPDYVETGLVREYRTSETGVLNDDDEGSAVMHALLVQALVEGQVPDGVAVRLQSPLQIERVRLTAEGEIAPKERGRFARFIVPYVFGLLLLMSIFMSSGLLVQGVAEEKQTRTIEILLSSISPFTLMTGKVLGLGAAGLLQIILWLFTARILASLSGSLLPLPGPITIEPAMIALGVLFFLLGYLFFATILAAVGVMATTPQEGGQMSAIVIMPGMIPYFLLAIIIDEPNGVVARVLTFIRVTAPITAMLRLSADTIPWMDIGLAVLIMVLSIGGALYLSARVFRAFLLLHGRRPGLREVWRTLRTAA